MHTRRFAALPGSRSQLAAPCMQKRPSKRSLTVLASQVCARWTLHARFGSKLESLQLVQQWVEKIGSKAGLNADNTRLFSGAVGVPESAIEMEVMFASMAEWEQFLAAIPAEEHRAWAQQIQGLVDGSPQWQVFRSAALFQGKQAGGGGAGAVSSAPAAGSSSPLAVATASGPILDVGVEVLKYGPGDGQQGAGLGWPWDVVPKEEGVLAGDTAGGSAAGGSVGGEPAGEGGDAAAGTDGAGDEVVLDWKGEPMRISPGDKLPFKFL